MMWFQAPAEIHFHAGMEKRFRIPPLPTHTHTHTQMENLHAWKMEFLQDSGILSITQTGSKPFFLKLTVGIWSKKCDLKVNYYQLSEWQRIKNAAELYPYTAIHHLARKRKERKIFFFPLDWKQRELGKVTTYQMVCSDAINTKDGWCLPKAFYLLK